MSNHSYNLNFVQLCKICGLGEMIEPPQPLKGGHLNKMFYMQTSLGSYAVKTINPRVIVRPGVIENYVESECIARIASRHVPVCPAKIFGGNALQEVEGQYYLVFDYLAGRCYPPWLLS